MKKKLLIIPALVLSLATSLGIANAAHYVTVYSSVDEEEIRWGGASAYSSSWSSGVTTWNARGVINIAQDTVSTYEDVTISDVYNRSVSWAGQYSNQIGSDSIQFNSYYMSGFTSSKKQNVTTHELGHALGLDHSTSGNVMYRTVSTQTSLGAQDISDYHYKWGY